MARDIKGLIIIKDALYMEVTVQYSDLNILVFWLT